MQIVRTNEEHRILVVDDDAQIRRVLGVSLSAQRYGVRFANDGIEALDVFKEWRPDVIITDLAMPDMDGLELCRRVRAESQVPIIILSVRGQERQKIEALDAGADDYVTKPFHPNELLARVRAQLRRLPLQEQSPEQSIEVGEFTIGLEDHTVLVSGREVHLTPKEFELLAYLARHPNKTISHRRLLAAVWGDNSMEQPQYLHVFVGHLRKKLGPNGSPSRCIITEPWVGYRFEPSK
jgi:two-component system KDP operon response regulator KdpE